MNNERMNDLFAAAFELQKRIKDLKDREDKIRDMIKKELADAGLYKKCSSVDLGFGYFSIKEKVDRQVDTTKLIKFAKDKPEIIDMLLNIAKWDAKDIEIINNKFVVEKEPKLILELRRKNEQD